MYESHYKWLDANLNDFWLKVFGKSLDEMWCAGIVSSHGDKCGPLMKDAWERNNIPYQHGVAIYLLTYTKEYGDNKPHLKTEWVIDNYEKYKPLLNP